MPWTTPETFTAGQTLTAASMNVISGNARMGQPVFTNEAARDAAITAPEEGMIAYLTAPTVPAATGGATAVPTGVTTIYNGSAWVCVTPVGAFTSDSGGTRNNTAFGALTGGGTNPSVTLATGTTALISMSANILSSTATFSLVSVAVSGATTLAASDTYSLVTFLTTESVQTFSFVLTGLTAGTNTFTLQYRSNATITAYRRSLIVQGIA